MDNSATIHVLQESVPREEVSISFVASRESEQWSRRTFNGDVIRFVSPLYRWNGASRQEYGKIKNSRWRVKTRWENGACTPRVYRQINTFPHKSPDKRVARKLTENGEVKDSIAIETKMDLRKRRIVMVISWPVPHCPAEEQRWKRRSDAGTGGGNARGKIEASRHPIFSSHFTKSRSYFTIPLVAGTILVYAPFSIRHCTPKLSIRGSRFHQIHNLTWSNDTFFFLFVPLSVFFFMFSRSPPRFFLRFSTARGHLSAIWP